VFEIRDSAPSSKSAAHAALDGFLPPFSGGGAIDALDDLCNTLNGWRLELGEDAWNEVGRWCRSHRLFELVQQDPYTRRAFTKPRGYAGDAVMLDYIYLGPPENVSGVGLDVLRATTESPNGRSILDRRDRIAREIDAVATRSAGARILAVAAGHLREAAHSNGLRNGSVSELIALDQDASSLEEIERSSEGLPVRTVVGSVLDVIRGRIEFAGDARSDFDLIYAAGLYDYLNDRMAHALSAKLFAMLAPGGILFLGNFTPQNRGRGYMEAFMDWHLICRDEPEIAEHALTVAGDAGLVRTEVDDWSNVAYVRIGRI